MDLEYLPSGLLKQETIQIDGSPNYSAHPIFSMSGKLQGYTDVHGQEYEVKYDQHGRMKTLLQGPLTVEFTYDRASRVSHVKVQDEDRNTTLATDLEYDDFSRETERTVTQGTKVLSKTKQFYGKTGLIASRDLEDSAGPVLRREGFEYNVHNRLEDYTCTAEEDSLYSADDQGRLILSQHFEFDEFDNVKEVKTVFNDGTDNVAVYTPNENDPTQLSKITNTHPDSPSEISLQYDGNGCLTRDEKGRSLEYDHLSRLVTVRDASGELVSEYLYDAAGRLVCQKVPDQSDYYIFYRENQLVAVQAGEQSVSYLSDGEVYWGQLTKKESTVQTQLWSFDSQQSVRTWVDTAQPDQVHSQQYTPYGAGTPGTSIGFNGQWRDPVTGWCHLGNGYRVYNPELMRFHTPDPWSPFTSGEINPYTYCLGDPINRIDPSGHFSIFGIKFNWKDLITTITGILGSIALGVLTGGASLAVQVALAVALGVAVEVTSGALVDLAEGRQVTWASIAEDALSRALGGLTGKFGKQAARQGVKAVGFRVKKALGRAGSAAITEAGKQGGQKITRKAVKKLAIKATKKELKGLAKSKAKEGAKHLLPSGPAVPVHEWRVVFCRQPRSHSTGPKGRGE